LAVELDLIVYTLHHLVVVDTLEADLGVTCDVLPCAWEVDLVHCVTAPDTHNLFIIAERVIIAQFADFLFVTSQGKLLPRPITVHPFRPSILANGRERCVGHRGGHRRGC